jgi:signal transduction histidine kinase
MARGRLRAVVVSPRGDLWLAAVLGVGALANQAAAGALGRADWTVPIVIAASAAAIAGRRRWALAGSVVYSASLVLATVVGEANAIVGAAQIVPIVAVFLLAYSLGTECGVGLGLLGVVILTAGLQAANPPFNPFLEMITFGPWLGGRGVISRRRLVEQLETRNRELEAGRLLYAQERVRYERTRIARELHDIVAHCLTLMVVQAGAGQRLSRDGDLAATAAAFEAISGAIDEAQNEMGRLIDMVSGTDIDEHGRPASLDAIDDLVQRTRATGTVVGGSYTGNYGAVDSLTSTVAYRVLQESLTNAVKHAPGVPVDVTVRVAGRWLELEVVSQAGNAAKSGLEDSGSGQGLVGMRARVGACGGAFSAGPTPAGGWHVTASLPLAEAVATAAAVG